MVGNRCCTSSGQLLTWGGAASSGEHRYQAAAGPQRSVSLGALRLRGVMETRVGVRQEQGNDSRIYLPSSGKAIGHLEPTGY